MSDIPEGQSLPPSAGGKAPELLPGSAGGSPVSVFAPEPFTAHWHAYELGRVAFQGEGDLCISPFEGYYKSLELAWEEGWDYGRQVFEAEMKAIREKAATKTDSVH